MPWPCRSPLSNDRAMWRNICPCPRIGQEIGLLDCPAERGRFAAESFGGGTRRIAWLSSVYDRRAEPSRRDVRVDDRAVALDDLLNAAPLQLPRDRRAVETQHPRHVLPGLGIWRDTAECHHRLLAGVVRRDGERQIVAEPLYEAAQMAGTRVDVLARVEGVPHAEDRGGLRHQFA